MLVKALCLLFLISSTYSVSNCALADEIECSSSICFDFYYSNSTCMSNSSITCTQGQVLSDGSCVNCATLGMTNCSVICTDYLYQTSAGSGPSSCTSCQTLFGNDCVRCSSTACLICAISSNTTLTLDGQSCINENCSDANCIECYASGSKCYKCKSGYETDANFSCAATTCSISNCMVC